MAWNRTGSMKGFQLQKYFAKCNFTISFHGVINLKIWKRILLHKIQENCWGPRDASFLFVICFPDYNDDDYNDDKDDAGNANHHYLVKGRKRGRRETLLLHCSSSHRSEPLRAMSLTSGAPSSFTIVKIIIIKYCHRHHHHCCHHHQHHHRHEWYIYTYQITITIFIIKIINESFPLYLLYPHHHPSTYTSCHQSQSCLGR